MGARRTTRAVAVLVAAMMLATGLSAISAPPAAAALTNVWPSNADGEPYADLTVKDALFVYVTSDLRGGRVCVIPESGAGSCDSPAFGEPNVIIGIGTVFQLIEGPDLQEGTFRLRTESARPAGVPGWDEGATSDVFTIGPCTGECDPTLGAQDAAEFKAAHGDATKFATKVCDHLGTTEEEEAAGTIKGGLDALGSRSGWTQAAFIGTFALGAVGIEIQSYNDVAKKILMMLSCEVARMAKDIHDDPPDPNFASVQQPAFSTLPTTGQPASDALAVALDRQAAYGIATRVAFERYQGALAAGDAPGQQRQLDAINEFGLDLANAHRAAARALRAAAASTEPAVEGVPVTSQTGLASIKATAARVVSSGFTPAEVSQLRALGATDQQIANARTWFARELDITPGATIDSALLEAADSFDAAVGPTDRFARTAGAVVVEGIVDQTPTATFTASPSSGAAPLAVAFDAAGSSDPDGGSLTYAWDFGDGATASGTTASHTFTSGAAFTVTLTVTDDEGTSASTTRTVTVSGPPANNPPVASFNAAPESGTAPLPVSFDGGGSFDLDADIVARDWDFGDGATASGVTATHTYTSPGTYTAALTVRDDDGATSTFQRTITVGAPSAGGPVAVADTGTVTEDSSVFVYVLENDSDPDGDPLNVVGASGATHGTVTAFPHGVLYQPAPDFSGTDSFTYVVSDGDQTATGTATVTVEPVDDPPVAVDDAVTTDPGVPVDIDVAANDTEVDGDALTATIVEEPTEGTLVQLGPTTFRFTPTSRGSHAFRYEIRDPGGFSSSAVVRVAAANRAPVAAGDSGTTLEDTTVEIPVLANDTDADGDDLTVTVVTGPGHGSVYVTGAGAIGYVPGPDHFGTDSLTYRVSDGVATSTASVSIEITPVNDAPVASGYGATTPRATGVEIPLVVTDAEGQPTTIAVATPPAHGTLSGTGSTRTYTPAPGYFGPDSFTYTASDGLATSAPATVTIDVTAYSAIDNGVIQLGVQPTGNLNIPFDTPSSGGTSPLGLRFLPTGAESTAPGCLCEGWGAADATSAVTGYANQANGTSNVVPVSVVTTASTVVTTTRIGDTLLVVHDYHPSPVTPNLYEVTVSVLNISAATVDLRYRRVMDWDIEPTAFNEFVTLERGDAEDLVFLSDQGFASADPLSGPAQLLFEGEAVDSGPSDHGALFDFAFGDLAPGATKTFNTYYGAAGTEQGALDALALVGAEAYSLGQPNTVDGPTLGAPNTFVFAFGGVGGTPVFNQPPVATASSVSTPAATPVAVPLGATDANADPLTFEVVSGPSHGTLTGTAPNLTYTPAPGYSGPDSFTFVASDGQATSAPATVSITVTTPTPGNRPPVASSLSVSTPEDVAIALAVSGTDPDGDPLTYAVGTPSHGTLTGTAPNLTYTPTPGYSGPDSFTFTVSDGQATSAPATVSITVTPTNDPPTASSQSATTSEDTPLGLTLTGTDPDGDPLTYTVGAPSHGTLTGTAPNLTYTPTPGYSGPDSFTFTVSDGQATSATATVSITVAPVNDAPTASSLALTTGEDTALPLTVSGTDPDGDPLTYAVGTPSHGTLTGTAPNLTYTPTPGYSGPDSFTFTVSDGQATSAPATVSITVTPTNDPPTASSQSATTSEDTPLGLTLTGTDPDGDPLTYTVGAPSHGTLTGTAPNLTYTPTPGYSGPDSFTFTVSDGIVASSQATVAITVTPVNDPPTATSQVTTTADGVPIPVTLTGTDPDGDPLTYAVGTPSHGTLTGTAPNLTYTPTPGYSGPDSFTFTVSDGQATSAPATISITVTPVDPTNRPPVAHAISTRTTVGTPLPVTLLGTDPDGDPLTYTVVTPPLTGTLTGTGRDVVYTPSASTGAYDYFYFVVSDGQATSERAKVWIDVVPPTPTTRGPQLTVGTSLVEVDYSDAVKVTLTARDPDGTRGLQLAVQGPLPAGLKLGQTTTTSGKVTANLVGRAAVPAGEYPVTIVATDPTGATDTETILVRVGRESADVRFTSGLTATASRSGTLPSLLVKVRIDEERDLMPSAKLGGRNSTALASPVEITLTPVDGGPSRTCTATTKLLSRDPGSAVASCSVTSLPVGEYTVRAVVGGAHFEGSAEATIVVSALSTSAVRP